MVKSNGRCRVSPVIVTDNRALFILERKYIKIWKRQETK